MIIKETTSTEDAKLIVEIYRGDLGKFGTTHTLEDIDKIHRTIFDEFEELGNNRVIFIGFENDSPVGTAQLLLKNAESNPELANGTTIAHIHHLRISYKYHKSGKGRELMEHLEKYAKDHNFKELTLEVDSWNTNAIGFYEHLGYKKFKEVEGKKPEKGVIYLRKSLA